MTNIVSQQHDVNQINVERPDFDSDLQREIDRINDRGGWDAAEYGMSRETAIARLRAADTPEKRAEVLEDLRQRAIRRASLDTSNGRINVMVAGTPAWHKLGVNVEKAVDSKDAAILSGTNFRVGKYGLGYTDANGFDRTQDQVYAIVREDTGAFLGAVGSRYQPIQNEEAFAFLDSVLGDFGAKYETCGSIFGGAKVWMLVHLPQQDFNLNGKDEVLSYALFTNPHDGSGVAYCFPTNERVICANTYRVAMKGADKGIRIRHTGDIKARIADARRALKLAVHDFSEFKKAAEVFSRVRLDDSEVYFNQVLDSYLDLSAEDAAKGPDVLVSELELTDSKELEVAHRRINRLIAQRGDVLEDIFERYESERCGVNGMRGTLWAGFNAVTEFADHSELVKYKGGDKESRRFEATLYGDEDNLKQVAFKEALALAL